MKISIKLNEYNQLISDLVKDELYDIGKNSKQNHDKLIAIMKKKSFPERFILDKIRYDCRIFGEYYAKVQSEHMLFECINITRKTIENPLKYINDPMTVKSDIESITYNCINMIINKKLIPKDEIDKYNKEVNKYKIKNQEIPKEILFKTFLIIEFIDSTNKAILSFYKLDLL